MNELSIKFAQSCACIDRPFFSQDSDCDMHSSVIERLAIFFFAFKKFRRGDIQTFLLFSEKNISEEFGRFWGFK